MRTLHILLTCVLVLFHLNKDFLVSRQSAHLRTVNKIRQPAFPLFASEKVKSAIQGSEPWAKIIQSFVSKKVVQRSITIGGPAPEADRLTGMQDSEGEGVRTDAAEDALVG